MKKVIKAGLLCLIPVVLLSLTLCGCSLYVYPSRSPGRASASETAVPGSAGPDAAAELEADDYYRLAADMAEAYRAGDPSVTDDSGKTLDLNTALGYITMLLPQHTELRATTAMICGAVDSVDYQCEFPLPIDSRFAEAQAILEQAVDDNVTSDMTDREKLRVIHDWVVNRNAYPDQFGDDSHSAAALVFDGNAVCSGYEDAVKIMCDYAGIPCVKVSGTAVGASGQSGKHGWNAVYTGGQWLHLDATFDDPKTNDGSHVLKHEYFLIADEEIQKNHFFDLALSWEEQLAFAEWYYVER